MGSVLALPGTSLGVGTGAAFSSWQRHWSVDVCIDLGLVGEVVFIWRKRDD